jgi:hypothetical protein
VVGSIQQRFAIWRRVLRFAKILLRESHLCAVPYAIRRAGRYHRILLDNDINHIGATGVPVGIITFGNALKDIPHLDLLKIDVESYEM